MTNIRYACYRTYCQFSRGGGQHHNVMVMKNQATAEHKSDGEPASCSGSGESVCDLDRLQLHNREYWRNPKFTPQDCHPSGHFVGGKSWYPGISILPIPIISSFLCSKVIWVVFWGHRICFQEFLTYKEPVWSFEKNINSPAFSCSTSKRNPSILMKRSK